MCWLLCLVLSAADGETGMMTVTEQEAISKRAVSGSYWGVASEKPRQLGLKAPM